MRHMLIAAAALITFLAAAVRLHGGEKPAIDLKPTDALVVREGVLPRGAVGKVSAVRVADPEKLAALEAFFPGYRNRPSSEMAGAWLAGHRVYFNFPGGETIRVTVSENDQGRSWTVGRGDFATVGKFVGFAEGLGLDRPGR